MPIKIECSDCGTALKVKEQFIGRKFRCPHCDAVNQVPAENGGSDEDDDDDVVSRTRSSSTSSRSKQPRRSQPRRSQTNDDDGLDELPQSPRQKKKKASLKSKSGSRGKVPFWAIVAGCGLAGVLMIAVIVFIAMKPPAQAANAQVGGEPEKAKVVQAQVEGPGGKIRMKFEMPLNWTSEGSIEDDMWPWATMKGQGQVIKFSSNRSLLGGAETMTSMGGADEKLKTSHTLRGSKLQAENTDWVDGQLSTHRGKWGPVIWSDYEYKGVFGKGYGIRCTVIGPVLPCNLMLECSQSARDKWRPTLLAIAESIQFVSIKNGQEERDDFEMGPGDEKPNADRAEMDGDPEDQP